MGSVEQRAKVAGVVFGNERFEMGSNFLRFVRMLREAIGEAFHIGLQICGRDCGGCLQVSQGRCGIGLRQDARVKFEALLS